MDGLGGLDLCKVPAQTPPDGHSANFLDPESLQSAVTAVGVAMTALSLLFTTIRVFVNFRKLHAADYFAVVGTVLIIGFTVLTVAFGRYQRHQWDVPACWFNAEYMKFLFAQMTIFGPAVFFAKAAIFLMYLQFFSIHRPMRFAVYVGLFIAAGTYLTSVAIAAYFGAPRPGHTWESLFASELPLRESVYGVVQGSIAICMDIYIFILPLPILVKLKMSRSKRLQLISLFGTALIAVIASVVALVYRTKLLRIDDTTWNQACTSIAVLIENNVAIVVGAMPAFASFLRIHVSDLVLFRSLRSKLRPNGNSGFSPSNSKASSPKKELATIGSPPRQRLYYELSETALVKSQTTVCSRGHGDGFPESQVGKFGILRSTEVTQKSRPQSDSSSV
ncbi:hypothetical protein HRG_000516 [Hirsutella rhossiliensis]|uniref:Rhodopsin domain-containing protein n=1 Tax=Hirsutella rhossiliensis TaxID=111463 RepID=A0A9P8N8V8_9HYPO|nr:uncharacterized protein HRG_00516 [Hirsutella rhossiliensis]KAH0967874.1 hypothetical protein HRG_00516 [Hirsutella rhossiliensis]